MLRYLLFDLGFSDEATAQDFLRRLSATLDFAGTRGTNEIISEAGDDDSDASIGAEDAALGAPPRQWDAPASGPAASATRPQPPPVTVYDPFRADRSVVQIPYSHDEWATLQAGFPLTEAQWDAMIAMLTAMKPGLAARQHESESD